MGYDAAKAAAFNKLKQQGLSDDQAIAQSGISDADIGNYALGMNGQMGPMVVGGGKVAGVDYDNYTPAELAAQAKFDQGLQSVDYAETARASVSSVTRTNYTSVSTETVSGGGSTTTVANRTVPTAASEVYAAQANAKQAEVDAFIKDNPSNFARKKQGLPPLSPEETQARQVQLDTLNDQRAQLYNTSLDARDGTEPTVYSQPNTTTTTQTVTTGVAVTRELVDYNNDTFLSQQTELKLETTTTLANAESASESVFDPRQDAGENVFDPGITYNGPATEESVFDPRQDAGENVFDPAGAVPSVALTDAAARINDPYYGLSPEQLKALGGADPTDPYIRARLGIPQLSGSTISPGGFAAFQPTGVPLIDNAVSAISGFASSLGSFFGVTTKPAVTTQGTTTGEPPPAVINTKAVASAATAVKEQNPTLTTAATENLTNIQEASANTAKAEEYIDINNRAILANEQAQAQALEQQRQAQAIIDQNNAELADDNLPDDRRAQLEANNAAQYASIAENSAVIDEAQVNIDNSTANNEQQANSILENQYVAAENAEAFRINSTGGLDANDNPVNVAEDPQFTAKASFVEAPTELTVTAKGTTTGAPSSTGIDAQAIAKDATAVKEQNPTLSAAATENLTNIQEASANTAKAEEYIDINNRNIQEQQQSQAQALEQQRQAQAIIDQNNVELADDNLPDDRRAELEANNAAQRASIAENAAVIDEAQTNIDEATANNEQQVDSILENQYVAAENAEAFRINSTGGVDENGDPVNDTANDPELAAAEAALAAPLEADPDVTIPEDVAPEEDPEIAAADAAVAAPLEANPDVTIPEDVDPAADAELEEPPGTEGEITDLAEPVDPESDPELLAGEEEEPFTELAEPPDPDATPELEQLAGEEDLEPYTELAEPPTDEPEQLGDPELEDGEITDLAEPVDPDADPELEQLGGPAEGEELEQLSGPTDVDTAEDQGLNPGGLSDEELLARQNPGGLSDEEILARQQAAEQSKAKADAINQATLQSRYKQPGNTDWRVRLALAPSSFYLYNVLGAGSGDQGAGILAPLAASNGVIFPYMPQISTMYRANYEQYDLVHSNFRGVYYKSSRVDDVQLRGTFTAQDTTEAQYLLAVIHFFKSVTKMFYGKDAERGTPPPLVYLSGLGDYQFSKHPCLVSQFSYTLPNDVDYIRATNPNDYGGNLLNRRTPTQSAPGGINFAGARRLANAITPSGQPLPVGATPQTPQQNSVTGRVNNTGDFSTYVPTMMEIDITLIPVQTRSQVSKQFSLKDFANGNLLKGGFW